MNDAPFFKRVIMAVRFIFKGKILSQYENDRRAELVSDLSISVGNYLKKSIPATVSSVPQRTVSPKPNQNLYGMYLENENKTSVGLILAVADTQENAVKTSEKALIEIGQKPKDYIARVSGCLELSKGNTSMVMLSSPVVIAADYMKKSKPEPSEISNYIYSLEYARDHFCDTPRQKAFMTSIVNQITKKYNLDKHDANKSNQPV